MKTVIIHGQNHKGSTYHVGRLFVEKVAKPDEISEFFLPKDLNHFCLGCYKCLEDEAKCPFYEEKQVIMEAIEEAELLVFTTPTYCLRASAPIKSFIDLTFINWMPHRPKAVMFQKKAVVFSTAAGAGMGAAMKDIKTCLQYWGVPYIKTLGFAVAATGWGEVQVKTKEEIVKKVSRLAEKVKRERVHVGIKIRFLFHLMKMSNKDIAKGDSPLGTDFMYWKENGWLDGKKPYIR